MVTVFPALLPEVASFVNVNFHYIGSDTLRSCFYFFLNCSLRSPMDTAAEF